MKNEEKNEKKEIMQIQQIIPEMVLYYTELLEPLRKIWITFLGGEIADKSQKWETV